MPFTLAELQVAMATVALAVARATGLMLITPFLGRGVLTGLARNGVIIGLSLPIIWMGYFGRPADVDPTNLPLLLGLTLKELFIGAMLGMPVAIAAWGLEAAGFFIDNQRGSTMASSLDPATGNQSSPVGILLGQVYTTWLFVAGGFLAVLQTLYESFKVWPLWSFTFGFGPGFGTAALRLLDGVMALTLLFAGPAVIAMFISELGLALVSRFAPQLQVFFLAMPVKSAVGLLILVLSIGLLLTETGRQLPAPAAVLRNLREMLP
jgi:type III secretion protein T